MDIEVRIRGLMMDPSTNMPIVVLKDVASDTVMPIWVGIFEANAIAIEIEKMAAPRPMTHDLTRNLIHHLNAQLERVVITELKNDTFFAVLWLRQGDEPITIDARPSDAIALALRADCPIYVSEAGDAIGQAEHLRSAGRPDRRAIARLARRPERRGPGPLQDVRSYREEHPSLRQVTHSKLVRSVHFADFSIQNIRYRT